ncbi:hypothetical protein [Herbiconiux sp. UC225_62]|uniref:hypothetical protein n=1 Tax=Herbiconiux sp. UC225_62 TaxID=3350168 RepID=UPI0036D3F3AE
MSIPEFDPGRRAAFRQLLVETVSTSPRRRRSPWLGLAVFALAGALAGGAVTAASASFDRDAVRGENSVPPVNVSAGLSGVPAPEGMSPGTPIVSLVGSSETFQVDADGSSPYPAPADSGWTAVVPLTPPEGATNLKVSYTCVTPGTVRIGVDAGGNNGSSSCSAEDIAGRADRMLGAGPALLYGGYPVEEGMTLYIDSDPGAVSLFTLQWVKEIETAWGVNEAGETYGNYKEGAGEADLMSATATNGQRGYIRRTEAEFVDGTTAMGGFTSVDDAREWQEATAGKKYSIPVYESDGKTVIGEFIIG